MITQTALVAAVCAFAAAYLVWRAYRTWRGGCATGCAAGGCAAGKAGQAARIAPDELLRRVRGRVGK